MPVRSLNSPVLRWPDAASVDGAVRRWARQMAASRPDVVRIGYFGSYARGDWGVGSDLDLVIIADSPEERFERRALAFDTAALPLPADVLVYTPAEWQSLQARGGVPATAGREAVWVYERPA